MAASCLVLKKVPLAPPAVLPVMKWKNYTYRYTNVDQTELLAKLQAARAKTEMGIAYWIVPDANVPDFSPDERVVIEITAEVSDGPG